LLAPKFDYTPFRTPRLILDAVVPHLGPPSGIAAALDVCCGTGAAMEILRPLCRERVVGVDFSDRMLAVGREATSAAAGTAQLDFVQADVLQMPFRGAFELAVCFGALGHILPDQQECFVKQVARALVPGGRFVFVSSQMPPGWSRRYWLSRGFNAAMHLRNRLISPPFVMFYLTFLVPEACHWLKKCGFSVEVRDKILAPPHDDVCLVVATRS
jgi:ubiquinone/menaquinone biosynthesis C-methylase UbiE